MAHELREIINIGPRTQGPGTQGPNQGPEDPRTGGTRTLSLEGYVALYTGYQCQLMLRA